MVKDFGVTAAADATAGERPAAHWHPLRINSATPGICSALTSWPSGVWNTRPLPTWNAKAIG